MTTPDPVVVDLADHETVEDLQRLAWQLHHVDGLPWQSVAEEMDEPRPVVQDLARAYIARTDDATAAAQAALF